MSGVKYTTIPVDGTIKCNNFAFSTGNIDYGPTESTGFYKGIDPPASGYTIYMAGGPTGINARCASNDNELISISREYGGTNINTISEAINYFLTGSTGTTILNTTIPNIVTDGLSLYLDAKLLPSYPRTGNIWYDLTYNNLNGELINPTINTPTLIDDNYIDFHPDSFSGDTSFFRLNQSYFNTIKDNLTLETWIYSSNPFELPSLMIRGVSPRIIETGCPLGFSIGHNSIRAALQTSDGWFSTSESSIDVDYDKWLHIVQTTDSNNLSFKTYINATLLIDKAFTGLISIFNGILIGRGFYGGTYNFTGKIGCVRIYNKVLSLNEIQQNYNSTKSRFGL